MANININIKDTYTSTIDVSNNYSIENISGFLHYKNFTPYLDEIQRLGVKYWRVGSSVTLTEHLAQLPNIINLGVKIIVSVSDYYPWKGGSNWISPLVDLELLHQRLDIVYNNFIQLGQENIILDLWNEPDHPSFFATIDGQTGTGENVRNEYLEVMKLSHDYFRSKPNGDSLVLTATAISSYSNTAVMAAIAYFKNNNVKIENINWHQVGGATDQYNIPSRVNQIKDFANRYGYEYDNIGIYEVINGTYNYDPFVAFSYLKLGEIAGVDGIIKTTNTTQWENTGESNNMNGIFNLSSDGNSVESYRGVYYAFRWYSESCIKRLKTIMDQKYFPISSYLNDDVINIIFGTNTNQNVDLNLINVNSLFEINSNINVSIYSVRDLNIQPQTETLVNSYNLVLTEDKINIKMSTTSHYLYKIIITKLN